MIFSYKRLTLKSDIEETGKMYEMMINKNSIPKKKKIFYLEHFN